MMVNYTYELSKEHIYPNISIYARFRDGVQVGWRVTVADGYVLKRERKELDPETGEDVIATTYHGEMYLPLNYKWDKFTSNVIARLELN